MIVWSKLRRSHGFGIHSPFAFDLVLRTLRERTPYYAYADISRLRHEAPRRRGLPRESDLKLIVRLVARFQPEGVGIGADPSGLIGDAVRLADGRTEVMEYAGSCDDAPDMVILSGRGDSPEAVSAAVRAVAAGGVALLLDRRRSPETARAITEPMEVGMTFVSRHKLLAVGATHLPRQNFEIAY